MFTYSKRRWATCTPTGCDSCDSHSFHESPILSRYLIAIRNSLLIIKSERLKSIEYIAIIKKQSNRLEESREQCERWLHESSHTRAHHIQIADRSRCRRLLVHSPHYHSGRVRHRKHNRDGRNVEVVDRRRFARALLDFPSGSAGATCALELRPLEQRALEMREQSGQHVLAHASHQEVTAHVHQFAQQAIRLQLWLYNKILLYAKKNYFKVYYCTIIYRSTSRNY